METSLYNCWNYAGSNTCQQQFLSAVQACYSNQVKYGGGSLLLVSLVSSKLYCSIKQNFDFTEIGATRRHRNIVIQKCYQFVEICLRISRQTSAVHGILAATGSDSEVGSSTIASGPGRRTNM